MKGALAKFLGISAARRPSQAVTHAGHYWIHPAGHGEEGKWLMNAYVFKKIMTWLWKRSYRWAHVRKEFGTRLGRRPSWGQSELVHRCSQVLLSRGSIRCYWFIDWRTSYCYVKNQLRIFIWKVRGAVLSLFLFSRLTFVILKHSEIIQEE